MKKYFLFLLLASLPMARLVSAQTQSFSFGAAGDFANGGNFSANTASVRQQNPDFFLGLGDFAYTTAEADWCSKWGTYHNLFLITGNHDSGESSAGNIDTYVANCPKAAVTTVGAYGNQYYFDYPVNNPIARFIMVRPGVGGSFGTGSISYAVGGAGYTFTSNAIDDARARGFKWVVVGMHKNYISVMDKGNEVGTPFMSLLFNKKVDLVLQGHEHGYERTKQLSCATAGSFVAACVAASGSSFVQGRGLIIDVLGTGGQGFRSLSTADSEYPYFDKATNVSSNYGWGKFTVSPTQIGYTYVNVGNGGFSDAFTITADQGGTPVPPTAIPTASPTPTRIPNPTPSSTPRPSPTAGPTGQPTSIPTVVPPTATSRPTSSPTPTPVGCSPLPTNLGVVEGNVTLANSGQHMVWSRIQASSDQTNSFYLQIDNSCPVIVGDLNGMATNTWTWVNFMNGNTTERAMFDLAAGTHVIKVAGREAGTKLDSLVFTTRLTCIPDGNGANCANPVPTTTLVPTLGVTGSPAPTITIRPTPTTVPPTPTPGLTGGPVPFTVFPVEDTYVTAKYPNTNYGSVTELFIDGDPTKVTYMKFDLRSYTGKVITSARLRFKVTASKDARSVSPQRVRSVSDTTWKESLMNFENRPELGSILATNSDGGEYNEWIDLDVTSYVKSQVGKVFSLGLDSPRADGMNISSSEGVVNNWPRIELKF